MNLLATLMVGLPLVILFGLLVVLDIINAILDEEQAERITR